MRLSISLTSNILSSRYIWICCAQCMCLSFCHIRWQCLCLSGNDANSASSKKKNNIKTVHPATCKYFTSRSQRKPTIFLESEQTILNTCHTMKKYNIISNEANFLFSRLKCWMLKVHRHTWDSTKKKIVFYIVEYESDEKLIFVHFLSRV